MDIMQLAKRKEEAWQLVQYLGATNVPDDLDARTRLDIRSRIARDAWARATKEYNDAVAAMPTDELIALSKEPADSKEPAETG